MYTHSVNINKQKKNKIIINLIPSEYNRPYQFLKGTQTQRKYCSFKLFISKTEAADY